MICLKLICIYLLINGMTHRALAWTVTPSLPPSPDNLTLSPIIVLDASVVPGSWCQCRPGTADEDCMCHGAGLHQIPANLSRTLRTLTVSNAGIRTLTAGCLKPYKDTLRDLTFSNVKSLETVEPGVFNNLKELRSIYIHNAPLLRHIPAGVFELYLPRLIYLRIVHTGLEKIPHFRLLRTNAALHMIDLENNQIQSVSSHEVEVRTDQLLLNFNMIHIVEDEAFKGSQIAKLSLKGNKVLKVLQPQAFVGVLSLRHLDLSNTAIEYLPTEGLKELDVLKVEATYSMKVFPSIYNFQLIKEAWLTYPYHCCAFHFPATHDPDQYAKHQEFIKVNAVGCGRRRRSPHNSSTPTDEFLSPWGHPLPADHPHSATDSFDGVFHEKLNLSGTRLNATCGTLSKNYHEVRCHPSPDAFNPCEDLMGNWALRVSVWFVAIAALVGNLAVLLVLISSRFRMTVPKFLMCNLAFADFCMGLYLIMIAVMDVRSIGDYFNHAIYWQRGLGCQMAGFLTVFSSVLSIFTLTVITCERWYTITYAIHLNRRLKLSTASKIMLVGWLYSVAMAAMPLFDVSNYSKTSICLPMKNTNSRDSAYLIFLLLFNGLAFWIICACYARMYSSIHGGTEGVASLARSDMTVARRMALLVFTDFACWAPIAFFGLTALAGYPLIDVPKTKILLVFFYPLNSCANPYLYALLTQQYRRDFFILLSRYGICSARAARYKGTPGTFRKSGQAHTMTEGHERDAVQQHRGSLLTTVTSESYPVNPRYNVSTSPNNNTEVTSLQHLEMLSFDYNGRNSCHGPAAGSNSRRLSKNTALI